MAPTPSASRDYRSPFTNLGVRFDGVAHGSAASFVVHECGLLPYRDWNHSSIRSAYWRLHYNAEAGNELRFDGRSFPLDPDHLLITPEGLTFDTLGRKTVPHLWVHYIPASAFSFHLDRPLRIPVQPSTRACLDEFQSRYRADASPETSVRLHHLCKSLLHLAFADLPPELLRVYPEEVHRLLDYIERHPGEDLSNARLATMTRQGLRSFLRWFKQHVGMTPARFVANTRVKLACRELALTNRPIDDIADALGYPNRYYFSRVFKQHLGCGPAKFRRST